jgi:hypothetical protein
MVDVFAAVEGVRATAMRVHVPSQGPWSVDADLESDAALSGRVTVKIGELTLSGTVDAERAGAFGLQRRVRVVAGAGAWGRSVTPKNYQNDAGVKALNIAQDVAREVGEALGAFAPAAERVGAAFARTRGPASIALDRAAGTVGWYVDFAGITQVGARAGTPADPALVHVLAYDPRDRCLTLAVDDPRAVTIGTVISDVSLPEAQTVRELEFVVTPEAFRVRAWTSPAASLQAAFRELVGRLVADKLWGAWRYRVVRMSGDRVELQSVRSAAGLPDVLPVSVWPGVAGVHATLSPGAECLVQFVEGDRTMPVVTHFAGKDGTGFVPVELVIGGPAGAPAARQGDPVEILLPPAVFSGTIGGSPASGVLTFVMSKATGTITGGSGKVKVAP